MICSFFPFEVLVRQGIEHLSVGPSHKLGDKCDRLHICSRKTHIVCKFRHYFRIHQTFIRIYFVLRLKILNLPYLLKFIDENKKKPSGGLTLILSIPQKEKPPQTPQLLVRNRMMKELTFHPVHTLHAYFSISHPDRFHA